MATAETTGLRLAELVALLSLGTDLGMGQPMEHMVRACLIALRMGDRLGLGEEDRGVLYYAGLLAWVGCHTDAYEQAKWFGDDTLLKHSAHYAVDFAQPREVAAFALRNLGGAGRSLPVRARLAAGFVARGKDDMAAMIENHYRATDELAERLGLSDRIRHALAQSYERWDGKGWGGLRGEEILYASRLITLTDVLEAFRVEGGAAAAVAVARERSGTQFDPGLVDLFCSDPAAFLADLDGAESWAAILSAEPSLRAVIPPERLDDALAAVGEFAELKSPWVLGHARGVAELAASAARDAGLPEPDVVAIRRAAWLQDVGRLGVSNAVWDKRGPLTRAELERVRLHPYLSERMLALADPLRPLAALAVQHHERVDGSGYPRGLKGGEISPAGRILAAADVYQALLEPRPHRPARPPDAAAAEVRAEVTAGRLDGAAVAAVLRAAGHRVPRRADLPAGLTARELEVLRLLARGFSNREIAEALVISRKTAGTHVEHIYAKTGASNRAQASLFALRHGLTGVG